MRIIKIIKKKYNLALRLCFLFILIPFFHFFLSSSLHTNTITIPDLPSISDINILESYKIWGGSADDFGYGIALDGSGIVFITGYTNSYGAGNADVFLLKYDSSDTLQWNTTWGGSSVDIAHGIALDGSGNAFITGYTNSCGAGKEDVFLLKYDSSGTLQWNTTWGGSSVDIGYGIALDAYRNIFITGYTESYGAGEDDVFLLKYDSSGTLQWNTTWGGSSWDNGFGIALDGSGNVFITGSGNGDVILLKYDSSGTLQWNKIWGGSDGECGRGIALDDSGNTFITGETYSYGAGSTDVFLLIYDSSGILQWNTTWGGSFWDHGQGIALDGSGNIFITGRTFTEEYNPEVFLLKYDSSGTLQWNTTWGGFLVGGDLGGRFEISVDSAGNAFITGSACLEYGESQDVLLLIYELDTDDDGLSDRDEVNVYGTESMNSDTDGDGLSDGDEVNVHGTDPTNSDTDGDGLSDGDEINVHGTDPLNSDTDGDGFSDGDEVKFHGTDPLSEISNLLINLVIIIMIVLTISIASLVLIINRKSIKRWSKERKESKKIIREEQEKTKLENRFPFIEQLIQEKKYFDALKELEDIVGKAEPYKFGETLDWARKKIFISCVFEKLYTLFKTSQSVNVYDLIVALDTDKTEIFRRFGDWSKVFDFITGGDFNVIRKEDLEAFMMGLEKSYDEWVNKEKKKKILTFISYSLKDTKLFKVREIAEKLTSYDEIEDALYCEEDTRDNFIEYMDDYVGKCDVMILFCSPNALNSTFVKDEWMAASAMQKPIIPVFTSTDNIPPLLRARVGVKFDTLDLQKCIDQLYDLILRKTQKE